MYLIPFQQESGKHRQCHTQYIEVRGGRINGIQSNTQDHFPWVQDGRLRVRNRRSPCTSRKRRMRNPSNSNVCQKDVPVSPTCSIFSMVDQLTVWNGMLDIGSILIRSIIQIEFNHFCFDNIINNSY